MSSTPQPTRTNSTNTINSAAAMHHRQRSLTPSTATRLTLPELANSDKYAPADSFGRTTSRALYSSPAAKTSKASSSLLNDSSFSSMSISMSSSLYSASPSGVRRASNTSTPSSTPSTVAAEELNDYTRLVCPIKLQEVTAKPRNVSPFDSKKYYSLLPGQSTEHAGRVALALDIDETLVHAVSVPAVTGRTGTVLRFAGDHARSIFNNPCSLSFAGTTHAATSGVAALPVAGIDTASLLQRYRANSDFVVHIAKGLPNEEMVFVKYRPHVHEFLAFATRHFEVIFFTASRACYADPLLDDLLARAGANVAAAPRLRLYREHCAEVRGSKVKDLSLLGRPLHRIALVDNLASSFMFQPRNGVHIKSWYGEAHDTELRTMQHMLGHLAATADVVEVLDKYNSTLPTSPTSPARTPVSSSMRKTNAW